MEKNQSDRPFKVRLDNGLKAQLNAMLRERKISQQDAGVALVDWIVQQDALVQLVVLGQVPPTKDVLGLIVRQWEARASPDEATGT